MSKMVVFSDSQEYELMTHITEYERVGFRKTSLFDEAHRAKANGLVDSLGQVSVIRLQRYDRSRPVCTSDDENETRTLVTVDRLDPRAGVVFCPSPHPVLRV